MTPSSAPQPKDSSASSAPGAEEHVHTAHQHEPGRPLGLLVLAVRPAADRAIGLGVEQVHAPAEPAVRHEHRIAEIEVEGRRDFCGPSEAQAGRDGGVRPRARPEENPRKRQSHFDQFSDEVSHERARHRARNRSTLPFATPY
jgi:hypothetical protein